MSDSHQSVACDLHPIKNGWKILREGVRIGLASSLGTALSKISRISASSGVPYHIRIFKEDGSLDAEAGGFSIGIPDTREMLSCKFEENAAATPDAIDVFTQPEAGVSQRERIALLAYSYWEKRGRQGGSPEEDWYRAEREVSNQV